MVVGRGQGSIITRGMRPEVGTLAFAEYKAQTELCTAGKPSCALGEVCRWYKVLTTRQRLQKTFAHRSREISALRAVP